MITTERETVAQAIQLTRTFGEGDNAVRAVDAVDLTVGAGELVLIMGPSGSGKTTLLTMLGGLLRPTSGSVIIDGMDITAMDDGQLAPIRRKHVGFIFQSFNLWETLTVAENVELTLNIGGIHGHRAKDRARRLLTERGLGARLDFHARDLSGGEKQRVSIARALANEPNLILADEPTANLDSKHGREVMQLLRTLAKSGNRAVIVVSHDQRIREVADRVLWLEDGRLSDMGLMSRDPVCGMSVEARASIPAFAYLGQTYYFCSAGCSWEFQQSPERFAANQEPRIGGA